MLIWFVMNKTAREEIETLRNEYERCYNKQPNKFWSRAYLRKCIEASPTYRKELRADMQVLASIAKVSIAKNTPKPMNNLTKQVIVSVMNRRHRQAKNNLSIKLARQIMSYCRHPVAQMFVDSGGIKAFWNKSKNGWNGANGKIIGGINPWAYYEVKHYRLAREPYYGYDLDQTSLLLFGGSEFIDRSLKD